MDGPDNAPHISLVRRIDVVVHELDGESVVYDPRNGAVHRFNAMTLRVWQACDGSRTVADLAERITERFAVEPDEALVHVQRIIAGFEQRALLEGGRDSRPVPADRASDPPPTFSRREILSDGAARLMIAAPLISTFFSTGAYASGPSASEAFGAGGCKNIGYSCAVNDDCCPDATAGCVGGVCTA